MADTIESFSHEGTMGKSWKNRFQNKWPTMTNLMQQSEITIQPYIHEYTDPHEIMAYQTCKIPDWDGTSQSSWSASRPIQQDMLEESSAAGLNRVTKDHGKGCEKTCRNVMCFILILSVVMAAAAAIGLSIFLNLQDHGLADHVGHHHGNHIHSNISSDQALYLSKLFCNVVVRMLRSTDFPVERGLQSCHTALLFIESSDDLHIEMHVSPKDGFTIKEKVIRALTEGIKSERNTVLAEKEKRRPTSRNIPRGRHSTTTGSNSTMTESTTRPLLDTENNVKTTPVDTGRTELSTIELVITENTNQLKDSEITVGHLEDLERVTTEQISAKETSSQSIVTTESLTESVTTVTLPVAITVPREAISTEPNLVDDTSVLPLTFSKTDMERSDKKSPSGTTHHPPIIMPKSKVHSSKIIPDRITTLPPIFVNGDVKVTDMYFEDSTTTATARTSEKIGPLTSNKYSHTMEVKSLPSVTDKIDTTQHTVVVLNKTTPSLPLITETPTLPVITETEPTQQDTKIIDRTTSLPAIPVQHDRTRATFNVSPIQKNTPTTLASRSQTEAINTTVATKTIRIWNGIPIATKLFNPEALGIEETSVIANANSRTEHIKSEKSKSPKIVESLMSGGVMKLPLKTNSNFKFLFSSDSKVKSANKKASDKSKLFETGKTGEVPNTQGFRKVHVNRTFLQNVHGQTKKGNRLSNVFTHRPESPDLLRTLRLPVSSTKSFIQRKTTLPKKPKRRLDLTEFGDQNLVFR